MDPAETLQSDVTGQIIHLEACSLPIPNND
jgi:hypothetical protein